MIRKFQVLALLLLFFTIDAYGYIDPGTGSYLIQILLAAFVGASLGVKIFWTRIKNFFTGKKQDDEPEETGTDE